MMKKLLTVLCMFYAAFVFAATDANKANETELTSIKGIGPATATRIVEARKQGPFKSWDDFIDRVKGVAEASASKLSAAGLTINGHPFKAHTGNGEKSAKPAQTTGKKQDKI